MDTDTFKALYQLLNEEQRNLLLVFTKPMVDWQQLRKLLNDELGGAAAAEGYSLGIQKALALMDDLEQR